MTKTMFFLVREKDIGEDTPGYTIGTQDFPKAKFAQIATHGQYAVVMYVTNKAGEYNYGKATDEYLGDQYQQLILDAMFGITNELIAKKCMNVTYTDPETSERITTSVYQWELDGFPGQGTHTYSKPVKVFGVDVE